MIELRWQAYALRMWIQDEYGGWVAWQVLAVVAFCVVWSLRTWAPNLWFQLELRGPDHVLGSRVVQAMPGVIIASALAGLGSGSDQFIAVQGGIVGAMLPLVHHAAKAYGGEIGKLSE